MNNIYNREYYKIWLDKYINRFINVSDSERTTKNLLIKKEHTTKVCFEALKLSRHLNLDQVNTDIIFLCALFHDVGRFHQYLKYKTFSDLKSIDHGKVGADILIKENILKDFDETTRELIINVVFHHNKMFLPKDADARTIFFLKIIRDCDKLDIWRVVTTKYISKDNKKNDIGINFPDDPDFSDKVLGSIFRREIVKLEDVRSKNDFKLLQAGLAFDINFNYSFKEIKKRAYIEKIFSSMDETDMSKKAYCVITDFICSKT